ncbi:MAG: hypothetical protein MI725_03250 [Pirellulales bacterium]|nr:hypothetical protein [Pirellulales bacterium]
MPKPQFSPGFRLSTLDGIVIVASVAVSISLGLTHSWLGGGIAFVVSHFFLFCNVFRISRLLELTWAGVFSTLALCTVIYESPGWLATFVLSLVITVVVVAAEMYKPSYHGIWWQRINPGLEEWWDANT